MQDQRHRVVAGVDDSHPQAGRGSGGPLRGHRRPIDVGKDLPRLDQKGGAGRGQLHVVGRTLEQEHPQLPFQTLQLLAQRGLDDVFARRGAAEVQLLGEGDEVVQLPKFQRATPPDPCCRAVTPVGPVWSRAGGPVQVPPPERRCRSSSQVINAAQVGCFADGSVRVGWCSGRMWLSGTARRGLLCHE